MRNYKEHRNLFNRLRKKLRADYYKTKCHTFKTNVKKLWALINNTITKVKHCGSIIPYITVNGTREIKPKEIANAFGKFYSRMGACLANKITGGNHGDEIITKIPRQLQSIVLSPTTTPEIEKLISGLPNKQSCGHDEISNTMLKALKTSLSFLLCHIFNQSLLEGIFPEKMKWAKVIPLYKGKCMDQTINY